MNNWIDNQKNLMLFSGRAHPELAQQVADELGIRHPAVCGVDVPVTTDLLVDFKGGATFAGLEPLPHTAAIVDNLEDAAGLVDRLADDVHDASERAETDRNLDRLAGVGDRPDQQRVACILDAEGGPERGHQRQFHPPEFDAGEGLVKTSAAWLIDKAGYGKGYAMPGPAALSTKHPLAITNRGGARAADIAILAREIREGVEDAFGVRLVNEPVFVGHQL